MIENNQNCHVAENETFVEGTKTKEKYILKKMELMQTNMALASSSTFYSLFLHLSRHKIEKRREFFFYSDGLNNP